jgi:hypothetical protein
MTYPKMNEKEYPKTLEEAIERIKNMEDKFVGLSKDNIELEKVHERELNRIKSTKVHEEAEDFDIERNVYIKLIHLLLKGKLVKAFRMIDQYDKLREEFWDE